MYQHCFKTPGSQEVFVQWQWVCGYFASYALKNQQPNLWAGEIMYSHRQTASYVSKLPVLHQPQAARTRMPFQFIAQCQQSAISLMYIDMIIKLFHLVKPTERQRRLMVYSTLLAKTFILRFPHTKSPFM